MQIQTERGLISVEEEILTSSDQAYLAGYSYAWHDDKCHCDLYNKCLDYEGHYHTFIRVINLSQEIRRCLIDMGLIASEELEKEIHFRCSELEVEDIWKNIRACVQYSTIYGFKALKNEMDDCKIWDLI